MLQEAHTFRLDLVTFVVLERALLIPGNCFMAFSSAIALWCLIERPVMTLTSAGPACQKIWRQPCQQSNVGNSAKLIENAGLKKPQASARKIESSNSGPTLGPVPCMQVDWSFAHTS